jgi:hypothetical protein
MNKCKNDKHDYHYYPTINEDGWRCIYCNSRPGEPPGFSPHLDRSHIYEKVRGVLHELCVANLISVSNGTGADLLIAKVCDRCVREMRFDQCSILFYLAEEKWKDHAEYWKKVSEGILAGKDPRDRCHCGKLANVSQYTSTGWIRYCSQEHAPKGE